ncbi:MAG: hypothetical protein IJT80_03720 [Lachnospiraceae bacterium]|nr:hypothetical protein [Lachnospiraceae bacterium]MCR5234249.1 hypothetical protein [Lachnospiraceae bacterium]
MRIGAVGASPYIYNTNAVSSASLGKIKGIGNDLTASKSDFSGLSESVGANENPLKMGETKNFVDIVGMQMQMGRMNASRVMDVDPFADQAVRNVYENMNDGARAMQAEGALDVTA